MADKEKPEAEEEEYESDLDDAPLSALWRRDAASDDEGEDEDEDGGTPLRRRKAGFDADSDGQGAAEVYDEEGEEEYGGFEAEDGGVRGVAAEAVAGAGQERARLGTGKLKRRVRQPQRMKRRTRRGTSPTLFR